MRNQRLARLRLLSLVFICITVPLFGPQWTESELEVWKHVKAYTNFWVERDAEALIGYMHDGYLGWSLSSEKPVDKATKSKLLRESLKKTENLYYDIRPVGIKIHGNIAIVHYYYYTVDEDADGNQIPSKGRWTDILMKQGGKWVMIGDSGGQLE
jgi:hypothetical protein